jgi:hypothetical protein
VPRGLEKLVYGPREKEDDAKDIMGGRASLRMRRMVGDLALRREVAMMAIVCEYVDGDVVFPWGMGVGMARYKIVRGREGEERLNEI